MQLCYQSNQLSRTLMLLDQTFIFYWHHDFLNRLHSQKFLDGRSQFSTKNFPKADFVFLSVTTKFLASQAVSTTQTQ